jgi:hypothetical protein
MNDYNFDLGSFDDIADVDLGNLNNIDFGSNFDLGSFEDLDLSGLEGMDLGSNFDLGSFEDLAAVEGLDLGNMDFGSNFDLGSFEDLASVDNLDLANTDFGSKADLGSFEDIAAADRGNRGYYDEITGEFIYDENGGLTGPLDEKSGTNIESMDGYTYDKKTGTWTTPRGETYTPDKPPSYQTKSGAQVMVDAGARPKGYAGLTPTKGSTADLTGGSGGGSGGGTGGGSGGGKGGGGGGGGSKDNSLGSLLPLLLMMLMMNKDKGGGGQSAVIPGLTATQRQTPYTQQQRAPGARPGQGGITYFDQTQYAPKMAAGGGISRLLQGPGDGVSDSIPAVITDGMSRGGQPAKVARGEYIMDARTVAALGNGSTDAGAERLDKMRQNILRDDRRAGVGKDSKAYRHLMA